MTDVDIERVGLAHLDALHSLARGRPSYKVPYALIRRIEEMRAAADPAERPDPLLPMDLHTAAESFLEVEWLEGARAAYAESASLYRRLDQAQPEEYGMWLGSSLAGVREVLFRLGCYEEALPVVREERTTYLRLVESHDFAADKANGALYWQAEMLTRLGRHEEAVTAAEEAVVEARAFSARRPGKPKSYALIHTLTDYADRLERVGRLDEALAATQACAALLKRKARKEPIAYAAALERSGDLLAALGRLDEATDHYGHSFEITRGLDQSNWYHRRAHAAATANHARHLGAAGRHREALVVAEAAVRLHRELVAARQAENLASEAAWARENVDPDWRDVEFRNIQRADDAERLRVVERNLCISLTNLEVDLRRVHRLDEADAAGTEALAIARRLCAVDPVAFGPRLALPLNNRAELLEELGQPAEALAAAQESVALYAGLAGDRLDLYEEYLAMARNTLGSTLLAVGRLDEAFDVSTQALTTYRRLAVDRPARFEGDLADALRDHGWIHAARAEPDEATAAVSESVALYRRLAAANPGRFTHELAHALRLLSSVDTSAGEPTAARAAADESIALYERLVADEPEAFTADLAAARALVDRLR